MHVQACLKKCRPPHVTIRLMLHYYQCNMMKTMLYKPVQYTQIQILAGNVVFCLVRTKIYTRSQEWKQMQSLPPFTCWTYPAVSGSLVPSFAGGFAAGWQSSIVPATPLCSFCFALRAEPSWASPRFLHRQLGLRLPNPHRDCLRALKGTRFLRHETGSENISISWGVCCGKLPGEKFAFWWMDE